jgi:hypothetical protein
MGSNLWLDSNERNPTAENVHGFARISCSSRPSSPRFAPLIMSGFVGRAFGRSDGGSNDSRGGAGGSESAGGCGSPPADDGPCMV